MKALQLTVLILFLFTTSLFSQEIIQFKGIDIDGNLDDFAKSLSKIGFEYYFEDNEVVVEVIVVEEVGEDEVIEEEVGKEVNDNNFIHMNGKFVNEFCDLVLSGSKKTKTIWQVCVFLPEFEDWASISTNYFKLKKAYTLKYGEPIIAKESFDDLFAGTEGNEMLALKLGKCNYRSYWQHNNGTITLRITDPNYIMIAYENSDNVEIAKKEEEELILEDI